MSYAKVRASKVPEEALSGDRMLTYAEICDGEREIIPVTARPAKELGYTVLEDVHGDVYLIKNKVADRYQLSKRPLGEVKSKYLAPREEKVVEVVGESSVDQSIHDGSKLREFFKEEGLEEEIAEKLAQKSEEEK